MDELVRSIQTHGIIEPLLVRQVGDGYELVAGERRLRAAQRAGIKEVPAIIVEIDDKQSLEIALIENLQREDLNPVDEARAYQMLMDAFGHSPDIIAQQVGKDRSTISNLLRLLRLPTEILSFVETGSLSTGHARTLLALDAIDDQLAWSRKIVEEGWSVRDTERRIGEAAGATRGPRQTRSRQRKPRDPHIGRVEEAIRRRVGTEVRLQMRRGGRGRLEFQFADREDLERILDLLGVQVH
jgi:ParB family chromosome partitioning protein